MFLELELTILKLLKKILEEIINKVTINQFNQHHLHKKKEILLTLLVSLLDQEHINYLVYLIELFYKIYYKLFIILKYILLLYNK